MPKNQSTAGKKARRRQAASGTRYTRALREVSPLSPDIPPTVRLAKPYLDAIVRHLTEFGWGADEASVLEFGRYEIFAGPAVLHASRDVEDGDEDSDPDDPGAADLTAPVYLFAGSPAGGRYVGDFEFGAHAGSEPPHVVAARIDAELGQARLHRVRGVDETSTTPCPLCGDRYPAEHLLANCSEAEPVCPACIFDQDQRYRTDLPYLAIGLDHLLGNDFAAPAGWSGVATLLGLVCGSRLGRKLERELHARNAFPVVLETWHDPLGRSWIWLPPPADRHAAFVDLGAGATISALTAALIRHVPTLAAQAKTVVRDADVAWRPSLLPASIAYAVAFSTQAAERDQHRTPVHVVDSTGDGLAQIRKPFAVTGEAANVENGLQALLEHLLFPLLLGHGLYDQPRDPRRSHGAAEDDTRPARTSRDAHLRHHLDRAAQVEAVLGRHWPGTTAGGVPWDGSADPTLDPARLGSAQPVNDMIAATRELARLGAAGAAFDDGGPDTMSADDVWARNGWWIPADDASHAVRQAREFLTDNLRVDVLWAGPAGSWPEPAWVSVAVVEVNAHSTGPDNTPWVRVSDGVTIFGMALSDIGLVRRADADTPLTRIPR
ncbi:hypothetical protein [Amycolatopsis sp. cmx-4-61]|uniref:hypothetical protein n=1 Tax=Amycolatopsis sp. cmx-4-61 TaxID=2790937 RepID=UPI003978BAD8